MSEIAATAKNVKRQKAINLPRTLGPRMVGVVVSDKMNKTRIIAVKRIKRHGLYHKSTVHDRRFFIHDEKNASSVGDTVQAVMTRPLSRHKNFRLFKILQKKEVK